MAGARISAQRCSCWLLCMLGPNIRRISATAMIQSKQLNSYVADDTVGCCFLRVSSFCRQLVHSLPAWDLHTSLRNKPCYSPSCGAQEDRTPLAAKAFAETYAVRRSFVGGLAMALAARGRSRCCPAQLRCCCGRMCVVCAVSLCMYAYLNICVARRALHQLVALRTWQASLSVCCDIHSAPICIFFIWCLCGLGECCGGLLCSHVASCWAACNDW
jgi:hypothetical protein